MMGSEEVTVEQEPILAAGGAAASQCKKGPVAPWLCVTSSTVTQDSTSVPVFLCAGWLGIE